MGRLKTLTSRLKALKPQLGSMPSLHRAAEAERQIYAPYRRWYKTARWQALRRSILIRDLFTCQMCGKLEDDTSKLVADHRTPHRGDERLFWDPQNLHALCKSPCHDSFKQKAERAAERHR